MKPEIKKYKLTASDGAYVELSSLGAGIVSIVVPDRDGVLADVVLGYPDAESYFGDGPCAGKCPGRYGNRIAKGHFTLDGKTYTLPINNGPNHLHGGPDGFQNKVWESRQLGDNAVEFMYFSEDGEAGYPGNLKVTARYEWGDDHALKLTFTAVTDAPTVLNLTNHARTLPGSIGIPAYGRYPYSAWRLRACGRHPNGFCESQTHRPGHQGRLPCPELRQGLR